MPLRCSSPWRGTRRGNFSQAELRGFELRGKTLGVIGTGRIGRRAIEIARGFGMTFADQAGFTKFMADGDKAMAAAMNAAGLAKKA